MFKRAVKNLCHKIYSIGRSEDLRILESRRNAYFSSVAVIGDHSLISDEGYVFNYQTDKTKIRIGANTRIMGQLCVYRHGGEIAIGDYCFVGPGTRIQSARSVTIGNRVLIAHNVNIYDHNSHPANANERHVDFVHFLEKGLQDKMDLKEKPILIEDDAWIGFNCTILKGVTIGKGAIIGANTVITENIPPFAVCVGNPARIVKYTD